MGFAFHISTGDDEIIANGNGENLFITYTQSEIAATVRNVASFNALAGCYTPYGFQAAARRQAYSSPGAYFS
jgi:hypothetical protein